MNAPASLPLAVSLVEAPCGSAAGRLEDFVRAHPDGTLFHSPRWTRMADAGCGSRSLFLVAERAGTLAGLLPLTEIRSILFGRALVSTGFATGGGILAESEEAAARLAEKARSLMEERKAPSVELRGGPLPAPFQPSSGTYSRFERLLPESEEALLLSIPRRQRAEVRRAMGQDLRISCGVDGRHLRAHFRVYSESVRNLGTPVFPRRLFAAAAEAFAEAMEIVTVWKEDRPLASMLSFHDRGTIMPYWGGGTWEAREARANDLIYYEVMRRAILRGERRADFGRSKIGSGPWARKRIWGFEEVPLVYGVMTSPGRAARQINPNDPRYARKVALWQKLPLWVANLIGPPVARGLG